LQAARFDPGKSGGSRDDGANSFAAQAFGDCPHQLPVCFGFQQKQPFQGDSISRQRRRINFSAGVAPDDVETRGIHASPRQQHGEEQGPSFTGFSEHFM
jgi:hypothetical protein